MAPIRNNKRKSHSKLSNDRTSPSGMINEVNKIFKVERNIKTRLRVKFGGMIYQFNNFDESFWSNNPSDVEMVRTPRESILRQVSLNGMEWSRRIHLG